MNTQSRNTITKYIDEIRMEVMDDITPERASQLLNQLSALYGSVFEMWVTAEMEYNKMYADQTETLQKITEARAVAKAQPEYEEKLRMEGLLKVTEELIRSMKYVIKIKMQEQQEVRY